MRQDLGRCRRAATVALRSLASVTVLGSVAIGCGDGAASSGGGAGSGDGGSDAGGDGWTVTYSGARSGEISGTVAVVTMLSTSQNNVSLAGEQHGGPADVSGSYSYPMTDDPLGSKPMLSFNITLADETPCSAQPPDHIVTADVLDGSEDTYHATFSGSVVCDDGGELTIEGSFEK